MSMQDDVSILLRRLKDMPVYWDGKACIQEMKEQNYQWRQMEWWAFYFELKSRNLLDADFEFPGDRVGRVGFDLKRSVNWDLKCKAIKSDEHKAILNDKEAMEASIQKYGEHGVVLALCDVEYNDVDRSFQAWHATLMERPSKYTVERQKRTSNSRYRKTSATLDEILLLRITEDNLQFLSTFKQGRNSNGNPRREKYMLDLEEVDRFLVDTISFEQQR